MNVHVALNNMLRKFIACLDRENFLEDFEITKSQAAIIGFVNEMTEQKGEVFQKDIEKFFQQRRSTISSMLGRLENKGYIKRETSKNDSRSKKIILTQKSEENIERIKSTAFCTEKKMLNGISDEEIEKFNEILSRMIANLGEK